MTAATYGLALTMAAMVKKRATRDVAFTTAGCIALAKTTGIAWTDATFNPWIGCTKVGPGCDHCYAEALDKRHRWRGATHWGAGKPRMRTAGATWGQPEMWQRHADKGFLPDGKTPHGGRSPRVFCASLADVFDNEVPEEWRHDLWQLIGDTTSLTWLILTKRIGNAARMLPYTTLRNVWLGATIVNQEEADRDVPKLLATPATKRFISYEPALGPVDWKKFPGIDWIIVGGESTQGAKARFFDLRWATDTIAQARDLGAAPFVKQLGSGHGCKDRAGAEPNEWHPIYRVQEFPA
jgi:protein gp37